MTTHHQRGSREVSLANSNTSKTKPQPAGQTKREDPREVIDSDGLRHKILIASECSCASCSALIGLNYVYQVGQLYLCWTCWALAVASFAESHPDLVSAHSGLYEAVA